MSNIYSRRLIIASLATSGTATYTVPAGKTAVVLDADYVPSTAAGVLAVYVTVGGVGGGIQIIGLKNNGANLTCQWVGRAVLISGDILTVLSSGGPGTVQVSGWELTPS